MGHILLSDCIFFLILRYLSFLCECLGSLEKFRQGASYCSHWSSFCSCAPCAWWSDFEGRMLISLRNGHYDWISLSELSFLFFCPFFFFFLFLKRKQNFFVLCFEGLSFLLIIGVACFTIYRKRIGKNFLKLSFNRLRWSLFHWIICNHSEYSTSLTYVF